MIFLRRDQPEFVALVKKYLLKSFMGYTDD